MLICIEGCDKQGKSSLAQHLKEITGFKIIKFSAPKTSAYIEMMEYLLNERGNAILDRAWCGEEVYGPIYRGHGFENWQFKVIEEVAKLKRVLPILCQTDNVKGTAKRFEEENETFAQVKHIKKIFKEFDKVTKRSIFTWSKFNFEKDKNYKNIDRLVKTWVKDI